MLCPVYTCVSVYGVLPKKCRLFFPCIFHQKGECLVSACNSALLEVCLCIGRSHLEQHFMLAKTCGGGLFALKSIRLTNCGSSTESLNEPGVHQASSGMNWFWFACGRLRMRHMGTDRETKGGFVP